MKMGLFEIKIYLCCFFILSILILGNGVYGSSHFESSLTKGSSTFHSKKYELLQTKRTSAPFFNKILEIRGGVQRAKPKSAKEEEEDQKKENAAVEFYKQVLPVTRVYLTVVVALTLISMTGMVDPAFFALDLVAIVKKLQLWRPITSACFLGPPSMSMAGNLFFLHQYGSTLEQTFGSAQQLVFLIFQMVVLGLIGGLIGFPFVASSLVSASLWCSARLNPTQMMQWQFGLVIPQWALPFGLMAVDILQAQSVMAAFPHILGILTGHLYHFITTILPLMGGKNWLQAPKILKKIFDPDYVDDKESTKKAAKSAKKTSRKVSTSKADDEEEDEEEEEEEEEEEDEEEEEEAPRPKKKSSSSSSSGSSKKKRSSSSSGKSKRKSSMK